MTQLEKAVNAYSEIDNTVVGDPELGIVICNDCGYFNLQLSDALKSMQNGRDAMSDALNNAKWLGTAFEF